MKLAAWTYEGPPHVGAMRVAASLTDAHLVLHAPQGDTYADLLFTMIERGQARPPVTYTTFEARDLGADTAALFQDAVRESWKRFRPAVMLVAASCTAELIQDDPAGLAAAAGVPCPVVPLELPAYQRKELWGAGETFYRLVRALASPFAPPPGERPTRPPGPPRCNVLGATRLGFRNRDDVPEVLRLLAALGVEVNVCAPLGAAAADLQRLGEADFNVVLYPEVAGPAAAWLGRAFGQPATRTVPIGARATRAFVEEVAALAGVDPAPGLAAPELRAPWWSASVDSAYLTGKRAFVFGDPSHAVATARFARDELGFDLVGVGTYAREGAREVRDAARELGCPALVTDDYLEVEAAIAEARPELVLGSQMERHIAKRLGIACAVVSAPFHVQDVPARTSPVMGWEGANVLFDTCVHPLVMGLEEHLLGMFRDDPEFHDEAGPSHLAAEAAAPPAPLPANDEAPLPWAEAAERELSKIPFFVRGKARRNAESYAREHALAEVSLETLYDAKAWFDARRA